jgi:hypothetical protein
VRFNVLTCVGQWAPIAGTVLALFGSIYALYFAKGEGLVFQDGTNAEKDLRFSGEHPAEQVGDRTPDTPSQCDGSYPPSFQVVHPGTIDTIPPNVDGSPIGDNYIFPTSSAPVGRERTRSTANTQAERSKTRGWVNKRLTDATEWFGTAVHQDETYFQRGKARDWVQVPGERFRNPGLADTIISYNPRRDADGMATPVPTDDQRSRAGSSDHLSEAHSPNAVDSFGGQSFLIPPPHASFRRPHSYTMPSRPTSPFLGPGGPSVSRHQSLEGRPPLPGDPSRNNSSAT